MRPAAGAGEEAEAAVLSERSRLQWDTYVAARKAQAAPCGDRDELHRFMIGVHLRGEQLTAPELGDLLDAAGADAAERDAVSTFVENGMALLQSYDRLVDADEGSEP